MLSRLLNFIQPAHESKCTACVYGCHCEGAPALPNSLRILIYHTHTHHCLFSNEHPGNNDQTVTARS